MLGTVHRKSRAHGLVPAGFFGPVRMKSQGPLKKEFDVFFVNPGRRHCRRGRRAVMETAARPKEETSDRVQTD